MRPVVRGAMFSALLLASASCGAAFSTDGRQRLAGSDAATMSVDTPAIERILGQPIATRQAAWQAIAHWTFATYFAHRIAATSDDPVVVHGVTEVGQRTRLLAAQAAWQQQLAAFPTIATLFATFGLDPVAASSEQWTHFGRYSGLAEEGPALALTDYRASPLMPPYTLRPNLDDQDCHPVFNGLANLGIDAFDFGVALTEYRAQCAAHVLEGNLSSTFNTKVPIGTGGDRFLCPSLVSTNVPSYYAVDASGQIQALPRPTHTPNLSDCFTKEPRPLDDMADLRYRQFVVDFARDRLDGGSAGN